MNRCASCATELPRAMTLCVHHHFHDAGWAVTNRIMCDFIHRGLIPARVSALDREDELRGCLQEAA